MAVALVVEIPSAVPVVVVLVEVEATLLKEGAGVAEIVGAPDSIPKISVPSRPFLPTLATRQSQRLLPARVRRRKEQQRIRRHQRHQRPKGS